MQTRMSMDTVRAPVPLEHEDVFWWGKTKTGVFFYAKANPPGFAAQIPSGKSTSEGARETKGLQPETGVAPA